MGTVFCFTPATNPAATVAKLPPHVDGVSWVIPWSAVEPTYQKYDFDLIEECLNAAHSSGRTSMLRVEAGEKAPQWAFDVFPYVTFKITPQGPQAPHEISMCIPKGSWVSHWCDWYRAYGAKYNGDRRIAIVQVAGLGHLGEIAMGDGPWASTAATPQGCGKLGPVTTQDIIAGWDSVIQAAASSFPNTLLAVDQ